MPITLSKIASNTASVTVPVADDTVTITYYPARVTEKTFAQLQAFAATTEETILQSFENFNATLAHLIQSWDVYVDDKQTQMYPVVADRLAELPISFRLQVMKAIMGDIRPEAIAPQTSN